MDDNLISHPRLIQMKEKELEHLEEQVKIAQERLYSDYEMLRIEKSHLTKQSRQHGIALMLSLLVGLILGMCLTFVIFI